MEASFADESMSLNAFNPLQPIIRERWIVGYFIKSKQFLRRNKKLIIALALMTGRLSRQLRGSHPVNKTHAPLTGRVTPPACPGSRPVMHRAMTVGCFFD